VDDLIRLIGLALRLPFFIVGIVATAGYTVILGGLSVMWFFFLLPVTWTLVGVPAAFFAISFKGSGTEQLKQRLGDDIARWESNYQDHFGGFAGMYQDLYKWFLEGSG
jgi:hypothetical protein